MRCRLDRRARVADLLHEVGGHVARDVGVHEVLAVTRRPDADDGRQHLVLDGDPVADVLGDVAVAGDDHDDRLADVVDDAVREGVRGAAGDDARVRHEQREGLGQRPLEVLVGVDRDQAVDLERVGHVDVDDAGMGVRAADERHLERVVAEVVEVATAADEQPGVLRPRYRRAEQPGRHACSRRSSAARSTEATMFW